MIAALVGLLLPIAALWWVLRLARVLPSNALLHGAFAAALGLGLSSLTSFGALLLGWFPSRFFVPLDGALWGAVGLACWWRSRPYVRAVPASLPKGVSWGFVDWLLVAVCGMVVATAFAVPVIEYSVAPSGQWDAWAIWNQKARFLVRAGSDWRASMAVPWSQPGHPLLVPLSVARLWVYAGTESTAVPALLSVVFGGVTVALVVGALGAGRRRAWVAGAVLSAPYAFSHLMAAQTADLPVGMFIAATLVLLGVVLVGEGVRESPAAAASVRSLVFVGILAGLTAWTKNEGLVFVGAISLVPWAWARGRRIARALWFGLGAAPVMAVVVFFKVVLTPVAPEYVAGSSESLLGKLTSLDRHLQVLALAWPYWRDWGGPGLRWSLPVVMAVVLVTAVSTASRVARAVAFVASVLCAGYYVVYVLTPLDLPWLVATTFERLTLQLWPALVLAAVPTETDVPMADAPLVQGER